ncbi:MAG: (2Fe-2S)-binding protein [Pseudomonadales bacterium]|nr:(2Fe-2S)-binding protein [Pseudomonadales bacterium]MBP9034754.1 (2Fe-2S)-binding protein [Pseudomonadales bacterium]
MTTEFSLNGERVTVEGDAQKPLLWVLREDLALTGAKFGCGKGLCGACTVQVDGVAVRSCSFPVALAAGRSVTTIEGLGRDGLHAVQQAWVEMNTPQCGYCQPGQIMSAAALLAVNAAPSDADIDVAMAGNLCRCGTYARIRKAIHRAADLLAAQQAESALETVPPAEEVEP